MDSSDCEGLDELKAELEKLRAEYKSKAEFSDNLRKAHNEQSSKVQEVCVKIEKQARELNENAETISTLQQTCEDLKSSLRDKESVIQHLRAANDRLRVDCDGKCRKLEETNKALVLALDEANQKKTDEEQAIHAYAEEIRGLKARLSDSQKKCMEAERKANASKELRERDEMILGVEEKHRRVKEKLKWKEEQFGHLEEAHEKLLADFKESKKEWEKEKSSLFNRICSLQTDLDSQTRLSDDLQKRLQMCNQALAHEETRRKRLEVQVAEFQTCFTSDFDSDDAKSQMERLNAERDQEVASLRQSLSTKAATYKEMEYQTGKLQEENEELRVSLKRLQEEQIQSAPGSPSLAKLRSKIKRLEQMNRDNRDKEAEWCSQLERMTADLNYHKSEVENKDAAIMGLKLELEQMQRDHSSDLEAKEYEYSSHTEKMREELNAFKRELNSKDAAIEELQIKMEQMHGACDTNGAEGADLSSKLEKMADEVKSYIYDLERKDAIIAELNMEMEQVQRECATYRAKEGEWSSRLEKMTGELESLASELKSKDATIAELNMEIKHAHKDCATYQAKETEWGCQLEKITGVLESRISEIERQDATIRELMMELNQYQAKETEWGCQLEKITGVLESSISELERKDATIRELKIEMEQMHRERGEYQAKEIEWGSRLEKMTGDLKSRISELDRKEAVITDLKIGMEELRKDCTTYQAKGTDLRSQLEKMTGDVNSYKSELEKKNAIINKLKLEIEQVNKDYTVIRAKETEWKSQLQKMTDDVKRFESKLERKDAAISELKMELEACQSQTMQLKLQNEELSVMLLVLKLGIAEAQLKIAGDVNSYKSELEKKNAIINKLKLEIEQVNKDYRVIRAKETEWKSQLQKMTDDVKHFESKLERKDAAISELKMELEACQSQTMQLKLQNEEFSVMLLVLKLGIAEAQLKIANEQSEMVAVNEELMQQVESKNEALVAAQAGVEEERERVACLSRRVEALGHIEKERLLMQEELGRYKDHELCLKQQLVQMKSVVERLRSEFNDAVERATAELAEKISEATEVEIMLYIWKSITENLRADLEVSLDIRKELEASLLAEVVVGETIKQENKGLHKTVENLEQKIVLLEQRLKRTDADAETAGSAQMVAAASLEKLQNEVTRLEQESLTKEFTGVLLEKIGAERLFEHAKEKLDLMRLVESLEDKFNTSVVSFSSQLAEKQAEINVIHETWEGIAGAHIMAAVEQEVNNSVIAELEGEVCSLQTIVESEQEVNNSVIAELEGEVCSLQTIVESEQKALFYSEQRAMEIEAEMMTKVRNSDTLIDELNNERANVLEEVIKLSSESFSQFSSTDKQLRAMLDDMAAVEQEVNNSVIAELEGEVCSLRTIVESEQKALFYSEQRAMEIEAEMMTKVRNSDTLIEELNNERANVLEEVIKLSSESFSQFSSTDKQLRAMLDDMVLSFEDQLGQQIDQEKENVAVPTSVKKCEVTSDIRSPFRDLNTSAATWK